MKVCMYETGEFSFLLRKCDDSMTDHMRVQNRKTVRLFDSVSMRQHNVNLSDSVTI